MSISPGRVHYRSLLSPNDVCIQAVPLALQTISRKIPIFLRKSFASSSVRLSWIREDVREAVVHNTTQPFWQQVTYYTARKQHTYSMKPINAYILAGCQRPTLSSPQPLSLEIQQGVPRKPESKQSQLSHLLLGPLLPTSISPRFCPPLRSTLGPTTSLSSGSVRVSITS